MARNSPSDDDGPNHVRSFLSSPVFRILLAAGAGYVAWVLWTMPEDYINSRMAKTTVPAIPIFSLKNHTLSINDDLVLIQNGVVTPLPEHNKEHLYTNSGDEVVFLNTKVYSDQPSGFQDLYKGFYEVQHSSVPFELTENHILRSDEPFVVVKKVNEYQLPLKKTRTEAALDTPVNLFKKVIKVKENSDNGVEKEYIVTSEVRVNKVTEESFLLSGARLENVFGRLRVVDGVAEIETTDYFPGKCFTMSWSEIKSAVEEEALTGLFQTFSVLSVLVLLGILFTLSI